ncbi:MAG: ArsR family transcriptional regulator [Candidatus Bathyarchaeia archaeon]
MGMGVKQQRDASKNRKLILSILLDGQWHRHREIWEKTKLSPTTLSKHLKELEKGIIERKIDTESGEYPPPVYYRLKPRTAHNFMMWDALYKYLFETHTKNDRLLEAEWLLSSMNNMFMLHTLLLLKQFFESRDNLAFEQELTFILEKYRDFIYAFKDELEKKGDKEAILILNKAEKASFEDYKAMLKAKVRRTQYEAVTGYFKRLLSGVKP